MHISSESVDISLIAPLKHILWVLIEAPQGDVSIESARLCGKIKKYIYQDTLLSRAQSFKASLP